MIGNILLIVGIVAGPSDGEDAAWVKQTARDASYSFAMPAAPQKSESVPKAPPGAAAIVSYNCTDQGCRYSVETSRVPVAIPEAKLAGALLASRNAVARKAKILSDEETTLAGWPARWLLIEAPPQPGQPPVQVAVLLCYVGNDFYRVRVAALNPGVTPKNVGPFFASIDPAARRTLDAGAQRP